MTRKHPLHIKREPVVQLKLRLPRSLHATVVTAAVARGASLNNTFIDLLRRALERRDDDVLDELRTIIAGHYARTGEPPTPL